MKIWMFYRDILGKGGVPNEIRSLSSALGKKHSVVLWGKLVESIETTSQSLPYVSYRNTVDLKYRATEALENAPPDLLVLTGFFFYENLIIIRLARQFGVKVVLCPIAQIMGAVLNGKIFTDDPDIRKLERQKKARDLMSLFKVAVNPYLKKVYVRTVGRNIIRQSDLIAVFSTEEKAQVQMQYNINSERFVNLIWGIDDIYYKEEVGNFYNDTLGFKDDVMNFVYWGRLDWYYKGIDRLLNGVKCVKDREESGAVPFRLFLIGPDYRGGAEKIAKFIRNHGLEEVVYLLLPGSYIPGSKAPLQDSDASICMSRWDGFPRTLRESTLYQIPILISKETHFGDLVTRYKSGIVVEDSDDARQVADALIALCDVRQKKVWKHGARKIIPLIKWDAIADRFIDEIERSNSNDPS